jgi:hypothetical protein
MLQRKTFIKLMRKMVELKKLDDEFRKFTKRIDPDSYGISAFNQYESFALECLKEAMGDDSDWIGYWLYEGNCGKDRRVHSVTNKGKKVPLKTLDNLFDCIQKGV